MAAFVSCCGTAGSVGVGGCSSPARFDVSETCEISVVSLLIVVFGTCSGDTSACCCTVGVVTLGGCPPVPPDSIGVLCTLPTVFCSGVVISLLASCPTCWFYGVPVFGINCLCTLDVLDVGVVTVSNPGSNGING